MVLTAFEEEAWPVRIDDPLPPHPEQDPKRRLHDTITSLNRHQRRPLIRFVGDGSGEGIRWESLGLDGDGNGNGAGAVAALFILGEVMRRDKSEPGRVGPERTGAARPGSE